jgi:predicted nucleic-acid-binding protein
VTGIGAFIDTSATLRLLVKDDDAKSKAIERLIRGAKQKGITLHVPPVVLLEIVWVLEKIYHYAKPAVREIVEAILNTPQLKCTDGEVFRKAIVAYESKNIKFADAVIGYWGITEGITTVYTYDEKDFRRIEGLEARTP